MTADKQYKKCKYCRKAGKMLLGETGSSQFKKDSSGLLFCSKKGMTVNPDFCCEHFTKIKSL